MDLGMTLPAAAALMDRVFKLDRNFADGAIHEFYILYYGSLPDYMGGSATKAREHFAQAVTISQGKSSTAYLSLAVTVSVKEQNLTEFKALLNKALTLDPDALPEKRLLNTINQRKAQWLLEHSEDYFVETEEASPALEEKEI
jgi:predicted anti-sigma-YlaC factor YlaD